MHLNLDRYVTMNIWRIESVLAGKGRVYMNKPKTYMTLDDRTVIQEGLNNKLSVKAIVQTINKSPSTVKREIAKKCPKERRSIAVLPNCANRKDCDVYKFYKDTRCYSPCRNCISCKKLCDRYVPGTSGRLEASAMGARNRLPVPMTLYSILQCLQMTCPKTP